MFSQQKINAVVLADRNSRGYPIYIGWMQSLGDYDGAKIEKRRGKKPVLSTTWTNGMTIFLGQSINQKNFFRREAGHFI